MTAMNIVRLKIREGAETAYMELHRPPDYPGLRSFRLIKTGEREYAIVGVWESMDDLAAARPAMMQRLNSFRDKLEYLDRGMSVTDPAPAWA